MEKNPSQEPRPVLTGEEADPISLEQAAAWTSYYRERYPDEVVSYFFGINIINEITRQDGCVGLRVYYANSKPLSSFQKFIVSISNFLRKTVANAEGEKHLIVVGADRYGHDQLPENGHKSLRGKSDMEGFDTGVTKRSVMYAGEKTPEHYTIAEQATPCPGPGCPKNQLTGS